MQTFTLKKKLFFILSIFGMLQSLGLQTTPANAAENYIDIYLPVAFKTPGQPDQFKASFVRYFPRSNKFAYLEHPTISQDDPTHNFPPDNFPEEKWQFSEYQPFVISVEKAHENEQYSGIIDDAFMNELKKAGFNTANTHVLFLPFKKNPSTSMVTMGVAVISPETENEKTPYIGMRYSFPDEKPGIQEVMFYLSIIPPREVFKDAPVAAPVSIAKDIGPLVVTADGIKNTDIGAYSDIAFFIPLTNSDETESLLKLNFARYFEHSQQFAFSEYPIINTEGQEYDERQPWEHSNHKATLLPVMEAHTSKAFGQLVDQTFLEGLEGMGFDPKTTEILFLPFRLSEDSLVTMGIAIRSTKPDVRHTFLGVKFIFPETNGMKDVQYMMDASQFSFAFEEAPTEPVKTFAPVYRVNYTWPASKQDLTRGTSECNF